jgi:hypothetical protein
MQDDALQTIGIILALIGVIVSIGLYAVGRRRKELRYRIISATPLLSSNEQAGDKLQILFNKKPVRDVHVIVMETMNSGNVPIRPLDFERPLSFHFGDHAQVLLAEVVRTKPLTLKPELKNGKSSITLAPTLLNGGDCIRIKVLVSQFENQIIPDCRIEGISQVLPLRESQRAWWTVVLSTIAVSLACWLLSWWYAPPPRGQFTPIPPMGKQFVVYLSGYVVVAALWAWVFSRRGRKR